MEEFLIQRNAIFNAMLKMLIELNIRNLALTDFIAENINNNRTYEENIKALSVFSEAAKDTYLSSLFVQFGELNLKDILGDK